ncbi:WD repeat-containing protein 34 [Apis mellifera caucasica]|uniref:WD repeat-containing protein 34 n=1 Tax=Apis mellifera TaxID=7460 RepID=A0A7M7GVC9_APIME|nr:WD repeat-containing protein 34 [Apis mellifera]KAG6795177.1 WD repeat-containing protein 34 [Apis mellifera caucasica]|eukprot:XP_006560709.1 WD repeat-containing protein 34 [Apis mellifera]
MFTNRSLEAVSFNSQLSTTKSQQSTNIQTTEIVYDENSVQTIETRNVETQTISEEKKKPEINYERLAQFLNRVTPSILEALDESYGTNAFEDYEPKTSEDSFTSTQLLQKINGTEVNSQMKVSDMSWSIGGGTLAVSYGIPYHQAWCDHLSKIQLYNQMKEGHFTDNPKKTLETNACVTTLVYHPTEPSIIAIGLFNGDVLVWNLKDDTSVAPTTICTHGDCVSQVYWKGRTINDVSLLVSSSKDGYIFIHKMMANFTIARIYKRLKIAKEHNPIENSRPRSAGGTRERAIESGLCITTFDFSSRDPIFFIVGTLCGGIYKCSLDRVVPIENDETLIDPVIDEYERHEGSITCIKYSPIRNLFVSASTDKEIRIYDFEEHTSLQSIPCENTIIGLTWMIGNQDILATYGASSKIILYNVTDGTIVTNVNLETIDRENTSCLRVNLKRDIVAIGDTQGNIEIWKIPRQLL